MSGCDLCSLCLNLLTQAQQAHHRRALVLQGTSQWAQTSILDALDVLGLLPTLVWVGWSMDDIPSKVQEAGGQAVVLSHQKMTQKLLGKTYFGIVIDLHGIGPEPDVLGKLPISLHA